MGETGDLYPEGFETLDEHWSFSEDDEECGWCTGCARGGDCECLDFANCATCRNLDEIERWLRKRRYGKGDPVPQHVVAATSQIVKRAIVLGRLKKPLLCEECALEDSPVARLEKPIEAHHDDYREPLSVRWLCRHHHGRAHHRRR